MPAVFDRFVKAFYKRSIEIQIRLNFFEHFIIYLHHISRASNGSSNAKLCIDFVPTNISCISPSSQTCSTGHFLLQVNCSVCGVMFFNEYGPTEKINCRPIVHLFYLVVPGCRGWGLFPLNCCTWFWRHIVAYAVNGFNLCKDTVCDLHKDRPLDLLDSCGHCVDSVYGADDYRPVI